MQLIALSGGKGHGKDTFAKVLVEEMEKAGMLGVTHSFAYSMKRGLAEIFGADVWAFHNHLMKEMPLQGVSFTPREVMMWANDAFKTKFGRAVFLQPAIGHYARWQRTPELSKPDAVIFTDLRFLEEASWVKHEMGFIVEVLNPAKAENEAPVAHESEAKQCRSMVDHTVFNAGSVDDLLEEARKVLIKAGVFTND